MNYRILTFLALAAITSSQTLAQTNTLSSLAIGTASTGGGLANGVVTLNQRIGTAGNQPGSVQNNLAGLQYVAGQIPLDGSPASIAFFSLSGAAIPGGVANPATDFESFGTLVSPTQVTPYTDASSKLTASSYSGLTFAAADLGFGSSNFYMIHHTAGGVDYFAAMVPGTALSTSVADLKPMSWQAGGGVAGGPASPGTGGYFGLAWATGILSAGAPYADQSIYYLRTDASSHTQFGVMIPALTGKSQDTIDLTAAVGGFGAGGYTTLAFSPSVLGNFPANQFYYLRTDSATGNTILGRLNPSLVAGARTLSDIANLGGVYNTLGFAADATGPAGAWGTTQFYLTGAPAPGSQSVSFEAIPNHNVGDIFTITPTASSGLDIDVTVVSGPATIAQTGVSGATPSSLRVFTVTTTGPGLVTLQARQAGQASPAVTANELQQTFDVLGLPTVTSPTISAATIGSPYTFAIAATGSPTSYAASPLPAGLVLNSSTGVISGTPSAVGTTITSLTATNATGTTFPATTLTITVGSPAVAPVITTPPTAPGTVGAPIAPVTVVATGSPTSYSATGLPPGVSIDPSTGVISGTPSAPGTYPVVVSATNSAGTTMTTLTITVASITVAPVITSPTAASGTLGSPFATYTIAGTGVPTSYSATGLPPGLVLNALTGVISGSPTAWGTFPVTINATNAAGTSTTTLNITILSSRIVNFSARAISGPGADSLIVGFVVAGDGKNVLVRGIGPALAAFGITNFLNAPVLTLYDGSGALVATDAGWSVTSAGVNDSALIASTSASVGAFPLPASSSDSALLVTLNNGAHTSGLVTSQNSTGVGLVEIYDTGGNPNANLINVSARMEVTGGDGVLIGGLVIGGNAPKTVLIRGDGPSLTQFGVPGVLSDPQITLYSGSTVVASNAGWSSGSSAAQLATVAAQVGAFPLVSGSKDSALLVTLQPGAYTVQVTSVSGSTGVALIEVYDTQ